MYYVVDSFGRKKFGKIFEKRDDTGVGSKYSRVGVFRERRWFRGGRKGGGGGKLYKANGITLMNYVFFSVLIRLVLRGGWVDIGERAGTLLIAAWLLF